MKRVTSGILVLIMLGMINLTFAQGKKAYIEFDKTIHDYGTIKESDGKAECTFTFKNTGGEPLVITGVKPNCGCTSPEWSKEPVAPGKTGFIKAAYDPANRPGVFNKNINVTSNAENSTIILRIKGDVVAREATLEDKFPIELGELRMTTNHVAMQQVYTTQIKNDTMKIYNTSDKPLKVGFQQVPNHIKIKADPETVKPKGQSNVIISYDASKNNDWGFVIDRIPLVINDNFDPKARDNRITISAEITEDFSKLSSEDLKKAPKIEFENKVFDFGTIKEGDSPSSEFKFKNTGKSDLVIRKVKATCGCTAVEPATKVISPGATSKIDVTFRSRGKKGVQNKTVTVITNDPENPTVSLKVSGNVTPEQP
jgi:hypothetical protein